MKDYTAWLDAWKTYHEANDGSTVGLMVSVVAITLILLNLALLFSMAGAEKLAIGFMVAGLVVFSATAVFCAPSLIPRFFSTDETTSAAPSEPVTFARQLETQTGVKNLQCFTSDGATANLDTEGFPDKDSYACRYVSKDGTLHDGLKLVIDRNGNKAGLFDGDGKAILAGKGDTA